jgi:hypothetical protein
MYHLTGLTKGYIKIGDKVRKKGKIYYKCKCTHCGKEWEERTDKLVYGDKGDCGCLGTKANIKLSAGEKPKEKELILINNNILAYIDKDIYYKIGEILDEKEVWTGTLKRWEYFSISG